MNDKYIKNQLKLGMQTAKVINILDDIKKTYRNNPEIYKPKEAVLTKNNKAAITATSSELPKSRRKFAIASLAVAFALVLTLGIYFLVPRSVAAPKNFLISGNTLTWDAVPNATGYEIDIDGKIYTINDKNITSFTIPSEITQVCKIRIKSIGGSNSSESKWTDETSYNVQRYKLEIIIASGGSVNSTGGYYAVDASISLTVTPSIGYDFTGWYNGEIKLSESLTYAFNMPENSLTLETRFIKVISIISFNANGGGNVSSDIAAAYDAVMPTITVKPIRNEHNFLGFFDKEAGGTKYYNSDLSSAKKWDKCENTILYAQWLKGSEGLKYTPIENGYEVSVGTATDTGIIIAETYNNLPVIKIADDAFYSCIGLIGINIPNSVISIGEVAFANCIDLMNIVLPNSVISIGFGAFLNCSSLTSISVANGNTVYKSDGNCLIQIDGNILLLGCQNSVIPNYVISIEERAFNHCIGLTEIVIPDSVISIGFGAFMGCSSLTNIIISESVTIIGGFAFAGCRGLTDIVIPNSVISIGFGAFGDCSGLTNINIPESVTIIEFGAFGGCSGLTNINIPEGVTIIEVGVFRYCIGLTSIVIPDSVTIIGSDAFRGCIGLTSIVIPDSVISIGFGVFQGCIGLTSISVANGNTVYKSDGNCIIQTDENILVLGCQNSVIPDYVTSIRAGAFESCIGLTYIVIPDSVISIEFDAFKGCSGLISIIIPDCVISIGRDAFWDCINLTIYSEASSPLLGWYYSWNDPRRPVIWGCTLSVDKTYVVSFIMSSESISNEDAENGISAPYRFGYTFGGWTTEQGETIYQMEDLVAVTYGTSLYAIWLQD